MLSLVTSSVMIVMGMAVATATGAEQECTVGAQAQPARPGGAMLQFGNEHAGPKSASPVSAHAALVEDVATQRRSQGIGASADLTEGGYVAVASSCCVAEMEEFARRVVADLDLVICDEGGLSGTVGFHTCENGWQSFAKLSEDIKNGQHGQCAWTAMPDSCGELDRANCGSSPDGFHRRRVCSGDANTDAYLAMEAPATEAPATEAPATEAPATEAPATDAYLATEAPATEAPATEAPATDAYLATEAPATEAPATEAPATEAPATEAPATEAPATEAPATEAPATFPPVAMVCVRMPPGTNGCMSGESMASIEECKFCAQPSHLGGVYSGEINFATAARGCYQFTDDGRVFFNTHPEGGSRTSDDTYCVMKR